MAEPPQDRTHYGEGTFSSPSGRWTVDAMVGSHTAHADGNEAIWEGTCEYTVRDRDGTVVIQHQEYDSPPHPAVLFAEDERSVKLSDTEFPLPA